MSARVGFDPIAVLEAGYSRWGDRGLWLSGVAEALRPALDRGMGAIAYRIPCGRFEPADLVLLDDAAREFGRLRYLERLRAASTTPGVLERYVRQKPLGLVLTRESLGDLVPHERPRVDSLGLLVPDGEGNTWVFAFESPRVERVSATERRLWARIALHLGASVRLMSQGGSLSDPEVEAIMEEDGALVHVSSDLTAAFRERLREGVRRIVQARSRKGRSRREAALTIWGGLLLGRLTVVDHFDTDGRRYIVARRNEPRPPCFGTLGRREGQVAFYCAAGFSTKEIAYALGLSASTVRSHVASVLRKLGLSSRVELVAMAQRIARELMRVTPPRGPEPPRSKPVAQVRGRRLAVMSVPSEPPGLPPTLTPSEQHVARLLLQGHSRSEIAAIRGCSPRTVANQIGAIYRKLCVGSTVELAALLAEAESSGSPCLSSAPGAGSTEG